MNNIFQHLVTAGAAANAYWQCNDPDLTISHGVLAISGLVFCFLLSLESVGK